MHHPRLRKITALFVASAWWASTAQARNLPQWSHALDFAGQQFQKTTAKIPVEQSPKATGPDGSWSLIKNTAPIEWTQGFFPGSLWYLYEATGDAAWKTLASRWTAPLEVQKTNTATHDLGFKMFPSFGHAFELVGSESDRQIALDAAASLASRYRAKPGIICMGDWNPDWKMPTVIDTMMDIELLVWAGRNGGDPAWEQMAISHAQAALKDLVRPDGSTFHVADYDPSTGKVRWQGTFQGSSDSSTWTRGQVWAMYGFARMYHYTQRPEFLDGARRTTEFFLSHLPSDYIAPWDFQSADKQKDSSAAAASAAALLELANVETDQSAAARYRSVAESILDTLSSPSYLAEGTSSEGVLLHGVGNYPAHQEIDVSLVYGDYYFIEALLRAEQSIKGTALVTDAVKPTQPDGGPSNDGGSTAPTDGGESNVPDAGASANPDGGSASPIDSGTTSSAEPTSPASTATSRTTGGCSSAGHSGNLLPWLGLIVSTGRRLRRFRRTASIG